MLGLSQAIASKKLCETLHEGLMNGEAYIREEVVKALKTLLISPPSR
jgi:hypothetical protein